MQPPESCPSSSTGERFSSSDWPFVTSHHREWLFSAETLAAKRSAVYAVAVEKLKLAAASTAGKATRKASLQEREAETANTQSAEAASGENAEREGTSKSATETAPSEVASVEVEEEASASPYEPPTLEELLQVQQYFAMQLLTIFREKGVKAAALEAACCFFHRFFLGTSLLDFDVRLVLFVCVLLALKATDVARHFTLGELLGDIEELDVAAVVDLELPVCAGLNYQLLCLTTTEPLNEIVQSLVDEQQQRFEAQLREARPSGESSKKTTGSSDLLASSDATPSPAARSAQAALDALEDQNIRVLHALVKLQETAEADCLLMHASPNLPLRYPPATLACAAVLGSPLKKQLLSMGLDVETVLKQRLAGQDCGQTGSAEVQWKTGLQAQMKLILTELQQLRNAKQQMQLKSGGNSKMSGLLLRVIEAGEVCFHFSHRSHLAHLILLKKAGDTCEWLCSQVLKAHADADSYRTRKKRRKAKKAKKETTDTAG